MSDLAEVGDAVLQHVHSVHVKDHVMILPEHAGRLTVAGVPMGDGALPIARLTQRLLAQGLRRFTFENVWAYSAPIRPGRTPQEGVRLGQGSFAYATPPFDPGRIVLDQTGLSAEELVRLEARALERGLDWYKGVLRDLGCTVSWA